MSKADEPREMRLPLPQGASMTPGSLRDLFLIGRWIEATEFLRDFGGFNVLLARPAQGDG